MSDATSLGAALRPFVPLRIGAVEYQGESLTVIGEGWSLTVLSGWTWHQNGAVVTGWDQSDAEDAVWNLCGLDVLGVDFPDPACAGDCSFHLSDGSLDIRSDRTGWETWTFQHDALDLVFVGV